MDSALLGSIIEASATLFGVIIEVSATLLGIIIAAFLAIREIRASREQSRLETYELALSGARQLVSLQMQDDKAAKSLLGHFGLKDIPEDASERREIFGALLQIQVYENMYYRNRKGFFPSELWPQWDQSLANSFGKKPFLRMWNDSDFQLYLWKPFVDYVNERYLPKPS